MVKLEAFARIDGMHAALMPVSEVLERAREKGNFDEIFFEGWRDELEWVMGEAGNNTEGISYEIQIFVLRTGFAEFCKLSDFDPLLKTMAIDAAMDYHYNHNTAWVKT